MMASRRTRIKGIANIPQRRKTVNSNTNAEDNTPDTPELGQGKTEEPNLIQQHEITADPVEREASPKIEKNIDILQNIPSITLSQNDEGGPETLPLSTPEIITTDVPKRDDFPEPESALQEQEAPQITELSPVNIEKTIIKENPKPSVPIRRKFIKPTVSLNAISRKPKENEEGKEAKATVAHPANGRNNKIVILNEVISYPKQNQEIIIHNHKPVQEELVVESQNHVLRPPEMNFARGVNSIDRDFKRVIPSSPQLLSPDMEYPIPPPSPSKINRARIKAIPRLGQRNTSFSASESEDESRRNYRHRNDSVCSSASGLQDTNSISECLSPQKPKEFNSVIQRKCRRTEQSRKLAEARRDFYMKFGNKKPDRQKLTMIDLIFYNPVTNPMSGENKKRKNSETESEIAQEPKAEEEAADDPPPAISDEENDIPVPQIKIGPEGELIVDEQSLVIENKAVKRTREEMEKSEIVNGDFETGYGVYKRAKRSKDWNKHETLKFYKALNTIGTDFALMCELFPRRSRRELKMKFKKEERVNKALVDKAIMQPCGFDFNDFKHEVDMEEKELQEMEKQKEREKMLKQEAKKRKAAIPSKRDPPEKLSKVDKPPPRKKKRTLDIMNVLEDDSDADESEVDSLKDEETEDVFLQSIQKPTRSGRVPKMLERYKAPEPEHKSLKVATPGSLIVVAATGPHGQPVYKVCMVTGDHGRQQIGKDMNSLQKALECKENGITNLFTLSATASEDLSENNVTIPAEENNVTIPAEEISSSIVEDLQEDGT